MKKPSKTDQIYIDLLVEPIRKCATYRPKLGQGKGDGYDLAAFQKLYRADPFYQWMGLDNPLMYAAHRAAGGMTSIYRQLGIGCEHLFRKILQDSLGLSAADTKWSYQVPKATTGKRSLSLDGRIPLAKISDVDARARVQDWLTDAAKYLKVKPKVAAALDGIVFEVRQGYKSKDSKRQNADLGNAAAAYKNAYLPCAVILSAQIDTDIKQRYEAEQWLMLTGNIGRHDPLKSTYDFMREAVGYDLESFFKRNAKLLRSEIDIVLHSLLTAE